MLSHAYLGQSLLISVLWGSGQAVATAAQRQRMLCTPRQASHDLKPDAKS